MGTKSEHTTEEQRAEQLARIVGAVQGMQHAQPQNDFTQAVMQRVEHAACAVPSALSRTALSEAGLARMTALLVAVSGVASTGLWLYARGLATVLRVRLADVAYWFSPAGSVGIF